MFKEIKCLFDPVGNFEISKEMLDQRTETEIGMINYYTKMFNSISIGDLSALDKVIFSKRNEFYIKYHRLREKLKNKMVLY